ncbi:phosphate ABC transporter substrate-binding protein PstS [Candidatus Spyradosoma sp. SGI.093]|uniref:phosphate ABC transporter substrate-binding protein PstS n=1 Tax=Candidatus Spyradosoma sp. SGI.093 TaxID=3420583 RepID=UPI003CFF784A
MIKEILTSTIATVAAVIALNAEETLNGAGASFPAPVYQAWTYAYSQSQDKTKVNYQSIGSGSGIKQIAAGTIDFAGTDSPLSADEQAESGLIQFPMLTGGVVVVVNVPGVANNALKLDQSTLADIFLGKITTWNDPAIVALNPGLKLPALKITVVRRSDASGTTFIFTNYLSKISGEWKEKVGEGKSVNWPTGLGGQKNTGVCGAVAKTRGAVGYTEFTYATKANLACVTLKNKAGKFVEASPSSFVASSAEADWKNAPGYYMELTDAAGENAWPITAVTYILFRKDASEEKKSALKDYFNWCFTTGSAAATKLDYVPLPQNVVSLINETALK